MSAYPSSSLHQKHDSRSGLRNSLTGVSATSLQGASSRLPTGFRSLLVPVDGTSHGERALPLAVSIARQAGAQLRLLHVFAPLQSDFYPATYTGIEP